MRSTNLVAWLFGALIATALPGCSPALNWREVTPAGAALKLMFPCKPEEEARSQAGPEGRTLTVHTASCKAKGGQYSLTWVDLGSADQAPAAMQRMRERLGQILAPGDTAPLKIIGMTDSPAAGQQRFQARPDEPPQKVHQAVFAHGSHVYQLLQQTSSTEDEAWDVFVSSVVLGPP